MLQLVQKITKTKNKISKYQAVFSTTQNVNRQTFNTSQHRDACNMSVSQ